MRVILNPRHAGHVPPHEVDNGAACPPWEVPGRFDAIRAALAARPGFILADPPPIADDAATGPHDPGYVAYVRETSGELRVGEAAYPSVFPFAVPSAALGARARRGAYCFDTFTPITAGTWAAALGGAAATAHAVDLVANGERSAYVLTRPPGHHAEKARCGGYSYLNNAAIAADRLSKFGRVAVLDIDVHHGNGTQHLFYDRADILFVSIHGDPTHLFPYFSGFADETGTSSGLGFNRNFPLPAGSGVRNYRPALRAAVDLIGGFRPAFLVVSFGADAHEADPIGGFRLPTEEYARMGISLRQLGVPTVVVQEGGYNVNVIGECVAEMLTGLGEPRA